MEFGRKKIRIFCSKLLKSMLTIKEVFDFWRLLGDYKSELAKKAVP